MKQPPETSKTPNRSLEWRHDQMFHLAQGEIRGIPALWLYLCLVFDPVLRQEFSESRRLVRDLKVLQKTTPAVRPVWPRNVSRRQPTVTFGGKTLSQRAFLLVYTSILFSITAAFILRPDPSATLAKWGVTIGPSEATVDPDKVSVTVPLKYLTAEQVIKALSVDKHLQIALTQVTFDTAHNSISFTGSKADVARAKSLLQKADVAPRSVILKMRVASIAVNATGKREETTIMSPIIITFNDRSGSTTISDKDEQGNTVSGWTVEVLPHLKKDSTVILTATLKKLGKHPQSSTRATIIPLGKTVWFTGMTDTTDKEIINQVSQGIVPANQKGFTGYYLEVTATEKVDKPTSTP